MTKRMMVLMCLTGALLTQGQAFAPFVARDPGVRGGLAGAGGMLPGLTAAQQEYFALGREAFQEAEGVGEGLGPRFNLDSCAGCHSQPAIGGSSPAVNPQVAMATAFGAKNVVPSFIRLDGPVREARFKYNPDGSRDGSVHALFVISGRLDPSGDARRCTIEQDDFESQLSRGNVIFRIPTPVFGSGLIEQIPDSVILENWQNGAREKVALGIRGRPNRILSGGSPNRSGNDGTIARLGWKAQNKSLLLFSGEAYNVEMGISNELFPTERDETPGCQLLPVPNDVTDLEATGAELVNDIQRFAIFMRFLDQPRPAAMPGVTADSIGRGRALFASVGCAQCHTPTLRTGYSMVTALRNQAVNLYSDLLLHRMGSGLADDIVQGTAQGDEFRTAPLWGLGQRIFFLHDGRTTDLIQAIRFHKSPGSGSIPPSEANGTVDRFQALSESQKQDLLNFLRSL